MMLSKIHSKEGFTLIEMLIVLTVVSVVLVFGIFTMKPVMEWMQKRMFISQLQSDLYRAHSYAITRKEKISIVFLQDENRYYAEGESSGILLNRDVQPPVSITGGSLNQLRLHITHDGTINNFGNVDFEVNGQAIELAFHIGRGRFVVKE